MNFIDLSKQNKKIKKNLVKSFEKLMDSSNYIMGESINTVQEKLKKINKSKFCILVSSGTDALLISLMALGIKRGDEVITTPFTWISTVEVIVMLGAKPVFVDVDYTNCNINLEQIPKKINKKTKAIIGVSLFGQMYDVIKMKKISKKFNIPVIEDGAQSFGSRYKNIFSCNSSTIGCTSFFPTKPLGCYGDGGAIFTNNKNLANVCREISLHGQKKKNNFTRLGINGRMDTLQSLVLDEKLKHFSKELKLRDKRASYYIKNLSQIDPRISVLKISKYNFNAWAQFTVIIEKNLRKKLIDHLKKNKIPTGIYYPISLNKLNFLKSKQKMPVSEKLSKRVLSLPMHPYLSITEQDYIIKKIKHFFEKN